MSLPAAETKGPIADLTYRNYGGPLGPPASRWWAIARMSIRQSFKRKGFWIASALSGYWYIVLMAVFFFVDTLSQQQQMLADGRNSFIAAIKWKDQFIHGYSFAQLFFFIVALLIATGSIANDNRANALLVYLSKPCSRLDYVIGKWVGVFLPLTIVMLAPMAFFWLYGALSFREYGFLSIDPLMLPKLVLVAMSGAAIHASLALGISALFNQARVAGATYGGIYFLGYFFTTAMKVAHISFLSEERSVPTFIDRLFYASIDGVNIAMAKLILGTSGSPLFGQGINGGRRFGPNRGPSPDITIVPSPPVELFVPIFLLLVAGGIWLAWSRVRAVEVV